MFESEGGLLALALGGDACPPEESHRSELPVGVPLPCTALGGPTPPPTVLVPPPLPRSSPRRS